MYLLIVVIASYSKSEYHASDSVAGLVVGLFIVGSLIGRFVTGKYVNRFGPKNSHFGLICLVVTQLLYFIPGSVWFLMMVRLMNGLATAVATTDRNNSSIYYTTTRKSEGISLFSLSLCWEPLLAHFWYVIDEFFLSIFYLLFV